MTDPYDPFRDARRSTGSIDTEIAGTAFTMFLRHEDLRRICRDPRTFTSDTPFRVPIPPEHDIRPTAQLPIESDPPMHTAYRRLMDPYFSRSGGWSTWRCRPSRRGVADRRGTGERSLRGGR